MQMSDVLPVVACDQTPKTEAGVDRHQKPFDLPDGSFLDRNGISSVRHSHRRQTNIGEASFLSMQWTMLFYYYMC